MHAYCTIFKQLIQNSHYSHQQSNYGAALLQPLSLIDGLNNALQLPNHTVSSPPVYPLISILITSLKQIALFTMY